MHAAVVIFDHLSVDYLGCYGNTWIETPHFDRFASRAVTFDCCFAGDSAGATETAGRSASQADEDWLNLIAALRAAGVRISVCSEHHEADALAGQVDRLKVVSGSDDASASSAERPFRRLVETASALADEPLDGGTPSLLWVESRGVPSPWLPPTEVAGVYWDEFFSEREFALLLDTLSNQKDQVRKRIAAHDADRRLAGLLPELSDSGLFHRDHHGGPREIAGLNRAVYAAYVSAIDAWFGLLLDRLDQSAPTDLLLIVTGRAGDLIGDHPAIRAGCPPLLDPLLRVPLIAGRLTGDAHGSRRRGLVGTRDLWATLGDWFGIDDSRWIEDSYSWRPQIHGDSEGPERKRVFSCGAGSGWSVRTPEFRCVVDTVPEESDDQEGNWLFLKPDDMNDILSVVSQYPDEATRLREEIEGHYLRDRDEAALDD